MTRRPFRRPVSFLILLLSHPGAELRAQKSRVALAALRPSFVPFRSIPKGSQLLSHSWPLLPLSSMKRIYSLVQKYMYLVMLVMLVHLVQLQMSTWFLSLFFFFPAFHRILINLMKVNFAYDTKNLLINVKIAKRSGIYCAIYFNYKFLFSASIFFFFFVYYILSCNFDSTNSRRILRSNLHLS